MRTLCAAVVLTGCFASGAAGGENWPQFRGPGARGVSEDAGLPTTWTATENIRWKRDLPGRGWSSPIVWGDRVFLTTVVNAGETEAAKKGLYFGVNRPDAPKSVHQWKIYCLNLQTGEPTWEKLLHEGVPAAGRHLKNSYASETPVTDGERVYAYFGDMGLFCLDMDGNEVWKKELPAVKTQAGWGTASSPVLHNGRLYILNDNDDESWLACFDAKTGEHLQEWGTRVPILGRVTMDLTMVDVTDVPEAGVGDEVVLFGEQGEATLPLEEVAQGSETLAYEVMCTIGKRVTRIYVSGGRPVKLTTLVGEREEWAHRAADHFRLRDEALAAARRR